MPDVACTRLRCWTVPASSHTLRICTWQVGERLDVAWKVSECPVYSDALLVHISAAAAAATAAAASGAPNGAPGLGGPAEREEWTALSLRFTQRCFSDGDSPALLFHQRCDGTDCPQVRPSARHVHQGWPDYIGHGGYSTVKLLWQSVFVHVQAAAEHDV